MIVTLDEVLDESEKYVRKMAEEKRYGDITVTVTLHDGMPVKLSTAFCEHLARRTLKKFTVHK